jgi:hypothetical protein
MRIVRGLGGALLWILACVVGLLGAVLSVTVILLPIGVPLLLVARKLFGTATRLLMPRAVSHPVEEAGKSVRRKGRKAKKNAPEVDPGGQLRRGRKQVKRGGKQMKKTTRRARKRLPV